MECAGQLRPLSSHLCQCSTMTQSMFHVKNIGLFRGLDWEDGQHVVRCFLWLVDIVRRETGLVGSRGQTHAVLHAKIA